MEINDQYIILSFFGLVIHFKYYNHVHFLILECSIYLFVSMVDTDQEQPAKSYM